MKERKKERNEKKTPHEIASIELAAIEGLVVVSCPRNGTYAEGLGYIYN